MFTNQQKEQQGTNSCQRRRHSSVFIHYRSGFCETSMGRLAEDQARKGSLPMVSGLQHGAQHGLKTASGSQSGSQNFHRDLKKPRENKAWVARVAWVAKLHVKFSVHENGFLARLMVTQLPLICALSGACCLRNPLETR